MATKAAAEAGVPHDCWSDCPLVIDSPLDEARTIELQTACRKD